MLYHSQRSGVREGQGGASPAGAGVGSSDGAWEHYRPSDRRRKRSSDKQFRLLGLFLVLELFIKLGLGQFTAVRGRHRPAPPSLRSVADDTA